MIAKALQLATEYNSDNNAVNSDSFTENDATGMLLKDDALYLSHLIRFLATMRGTRTAAPIILLPIMRMPLYSL